MRLYFTAASVIIALLLSSFVFQITII